MRWCLRYSLSYRDIELLAERGVEVDHTTVFGGALHTPLFVEAGRPARHTPGDRWFVDETYVKVDGAWRYLYRALDQSGQVIDVYVSRRRHRAAVRRVFQRALAVAAQPVEVTTDRALVYLHLLDELLPAARHVTDRHDNNRVEADRGRLKCAAPADARPETRPALRTVAAGHAFVPNLRRCHYGLAVELPTRHAVPAAFTELIPAS